MFFWQVVGRGKQSRQGDDHRPLSRYAAGQNEKATAVDYENCETHDETTIDNGSRLSLAAHNRHCKCQIWAACRTLRGMLRIAFVQLHSSQACATRAFDRRGCCGRIYFQTSASTVTLFRLFRLILGQDQFDLASLLQLPYRRNDGGHCGFGIPGPDATLFADFVAQGFCQSG